MAGNNELNEFVGRALGRGASRREVEEALLRAGWGRDLVQGALAGYADVDFVVPVPRPRPYVSARDAFVYLLLFGTLYIAAFNTGALLFLCINYTFPDAAVPDHVAGYVRDAARWALSSLLVAFPVFLYLSASVERRLRRDPVQRRSSVRRWLMYVTVLVAAAILLGDVIALIYNLLGGELTVRFLLKVLAIGAIAGAILGYYLSDLRLADTTPDVERAGRPRLLAAVVIAVVAAVAAGGVFLIGAPSAERMRQLDARRVDGLQQTTLATNVYFQRHGRLPASLEELARGGVGAPATDAGLGPFEYRVTGERTFELCATFQQASADRTPYGERGFWVHGVGRQCFPQRVRDAG